MTNAPAFRPRPEGAKSSRSCMPREFDEANFLAILPEACRIVIVRYFRSITAGRLRPAATYSRANDA